MTGHVLNTQLAYDFCCSPSSLNSNAQIPQNSCYPIEQKGKEEPGIDLSQECSFIAAGHLIEIRSSPNPTGNRQNRKMPSNVYTYCNFKPKADHTCYSLIVQTPFNVLKQLYIAKVYLTGCIMKSTVLVGPCSTYLLANTFFCLALKLDERWIWERRGRDAHAFSSSNPIG